MGDLLKHENKMGESAASDDVLEVSVSFGRFENDSSLSWEKWSSFSPNKYLEEVEKCSTPGSVAQKKAYFEAHYKKIAARKAELLDPEKQMGTEPLRSDDPGNGDLTRKSDGNDTEFDVSNNGQCSGEGDDQDSSNLITASELTESNGGTPIAIECQSLTVEEAQEEMDNGQNTPKLNGGEETVLVKVEASQMGSQEVPASLLKNGTRDDADAPRVKKEKAKLDPPKETKKITSANKERKSTSVMKKVASPQISNPRDSKPKPKPTPTPMPTSKKMSSSQSSLKKGNGSSLLKGKNSPAGEIKKPSPRSKIPSAGEHKKVAPTSLHMSLCQSPLHPGSGSLTTTRKSLIMEKMGDKDIVRRAFKTFQNSFNQLKPSSEVRSSAPQQVSAKSTEPSVSTSITPQRDKERPLKAGTLDKKNTKTAPSFGLRSNERAEKRKEFFKKLEEKSNAKETEKTHLQSKSKEQKEAEIKKLRHSLNFKATPMPGFYQGQRTSKSDFNKEVANRSSSLA